MTALDMLAQLGRDWSVTLGSRSGAASGWSLRLRSKDGDAHIYDGDDLSRVIARAYLGEKADRKESRYARG